jgi:hypothetical protein
MLEIAPIHPAKRPNNNTIWHVLTEVASHFNDRIINRHWPLHRSSHGHNRVSDHELSIRSRTWLRFYLRQAVWQNLQPAIIPVGFPVEKIASIIINSLSVSNLAVPFCESHSRRIGTQPKLQIPRVCREQPSSLRAMCWNDHDSASRILKARCILTRESRWVLRPVKIQSRIDRIRNINFLVPRKL